MWTNVSTRVLSLHLRVISVFRTRSDTALCNWPRHCVLIGQRCATTTMVVCERSCSHARRHVHCGANCVNLGQVLFIRVTKLRHESRGGTKGVNFDSFVSNAEHGQLGERCTNVVFVAKKKRRRCGRGAWEGCTRGANLFHMLNFV